MPFEHKLGLVVGNFAAPGFAQAVLGKRRAALIWAALVLVPALLGTFSVWLPTLSMLVHFAAIIGAVVELHRRRISEAPPRWWHALSIAVLVLGLASYAFLRGTIEAFKIPSSSMYPTLEIGDHVYVDKLSLLWHPPERGEVVVFHYPCAPDRQYVKRVIARGGDTVEVRCNVVYVNGAAIQPALINAHDHYQDYDEQDHRWFTRDCSRYRETHGSHTYDVFQAVEQDAARDFPLRDRMLVPSCSQNDFYDHPAHIPVPLGSIVVTKQNASACEPQAHYVVPANTLFVMGDNRNNANDSRYWGAVTTDAVIGRVMGIWLTDRPGGSPSFGRAGTIQ